MSSLYLILFEICPDSPAFVIGQCVSVLLEKCIDPGDSSVPGVFQILEGQSSKGQETHLLDQTSFSSHLYTFVESRLLRPYSMFMSQTNVV